MEKTQLDPNLQAKLLSQLENWVRADDLLMALLDAVKQEAPHGSFVAAGAIRNLAWDRLHDYDTRTSLHDADVVYYAADTLSTEPERQAEQSLQCRIPDVQWQVRNQARMHIRNGDAPYLTLERALQAWPETATAVGVRLSDDNSLEWVHPWGLNDLFDLKLRRSPLCRNPAKFTERIQDKKWLERWPQLTIENS